MKELQDIHARKRIRILSVFVFAHLFDLNVYCSKNSRHNLPL
jgi:hypothetical protein